MECKTAPSMVRGSRACVPGVVVSALGVEGGSRLLGDYEGAEGKDDAELAKPQNAGYGLMQSRNGEEERGQAKSAISFYGALRWNHSPSTFSNQLVEIPNLSQVTYPSLVHCPQSLPCHNRRRHRPLMVHTVPVPLQTPSHPLGGATGY